MMQRNNFEILPATTDDIPGMARLEEMCFSAPWSEKALSDTMAGESACFLVAKREGRVIGYIGSYSALDEGYVTNVATDTECRREGVGKALVSELIRCGKEKSLSFWTLEVRVGNTAAISLYEKLGFERVGVRPRFYSNPCEDALLMTLYL